jgi:uncharacterized repeat protein (TIGR04138 family)
MDGINFDEVLDKIVAHDPRYQREAYLFLREALDHTQKMILKTAAAASARQPIKDDAPRHVSGQQLLEGIRDYATQQFGPMAATVLNEWGIKRCEDFGELVFNMVEKSLLAKTDKDSRDDFKGGYDFDAAFRQPYLPKSQLNAQAKPTALKGV